MFDATGRMENCRALVGRRRAPHVVFVVLGLPGAIVAAVEPDFAAARSCA